MEILKLSEAKPRMGRLIDRALDGEPVVIRRGNRLVQLTEYVVPAPIPERPVGYFRRRPADYARANRAPADLAPVR
jgi:antitoxin (DNA-binding transcriptional repressor) of toxin-antitoxin stability system